jgi:predicted nucleic acid-binding protein
MIQREEDFVRLVDSFIVETKDARILEEISQLDRESRLLGISFYDLYCVVLQDKNKHQHLIAEFKTYTSLKKAQTSLI